MDFKYALEKSLLEEYDHCGGAPDEKAREKLGKLAKFIIEETPFEELKKLSDELFDSPPLALISFDADKIKDYVFASSRPKEVRGASAVIEEFTDEQDGKIKEWLKEFVDENHIIFAGGGAGIILAPAHLAKRIKEKIETEFRKLTITASCTVEYETFFPFEFIYGKESEKIKFNPSEEKEKIKCYLDEEYLSSVSDQKPIPFGKLAELLGAKIRKTKNSKLREEFYPLSGIFRRCTSCGIRPASRMDEEDPRYEEYKRKNEPWRTAICDSCYKKREIGKAKKKEEFVGWHFQELVKDYSKKYLLLLYIDVNKMGATREKLKTTQEYWDFSEYIDKTFCQVIENMKVKLRWKYQSLVMGGDDLILILPAQEINRVYKILSSIERQFKNPPEHFSETLQSELKKLTFAVGIVIAPSHFPIKFLVDYAFEVMKDAKKESYRTEQGAVSFLVLKDSSPLNILIEEYIEANYKKEFFHMTLRPYTMGDFREKLIDPLLKLKEIPKAQLNIIKDLILNESPPVALLNIRYQTVKMRKKWEIVLGKRVTEWGDFFIKKENEIYKTGYIDLLELLEFWEGGKSEA